MGNESNKGGGREYGQLLVPRNKRSPMPWGSIVRKLGFITFQARFDTHFDKFGRSKCPIGKGKCPQGSQRPGTMGIYFDSRPGVYPFFDSARMASEESAAIARRFSVEYRHAKQTRKEVAAP